MSDSIEVSPDASAVATDHEIILNRVGHVTRMLHDNLSDLGFDKILEQVATKIPDARDRLNYVARMTEQAAVRVLNATDLANPLQDGLARQARELKQCWEETLLVPSVQSEYSAAAEKTVFFLQKTEESTTRTKELLMEIMMAQDFQDLTGQVIKRVTVLAQEIEQQLVQVLIDFSPSSAKDDTEKSLMNGPQINPEQTKDIVSSQEQVDDLLDSFGF
ncbi:protein phosphatase CheZ [Polynucleobacter aenigmaticus]|uniref:Protein phosphatase CheZ n=1 Tax=Polynucleobacter aenigmaticus TaxID=1743164 RepID=A0A254Q2V3_9BURK|nr:protein phosphatase CheZ [Polynucleobacter aenigmaticus]OWS71886.1 protein phosphatase CheZ [Polynucleobacter aenigmaticus]